MTDTLPARAELIAGQQFAWSRRTPLQRAAVDGAQAALTGALARIDPGAHVVREPDLLLSAQAVLIPDLAVYRGPTWTLPDLVVEYRAESTDRLFFGPKRLAYARARVPEVWFVDMTKESLTVLCLTGALDYPWPARAYGRDDVVRSAAIAGLNVAVRDFLPAESERHGRS